MWNDEILDYCRQAKDLTFIFLTKYPEYLPKEWTDNCWVGQTLTGTEKDLFTRMGRFALIEAKVKFISLEPLLDSIPKIDVLRELFHQNFKAAGVNWLIIGAQTPYSKKSAPTIEWVKEIVDAADKVKIPVFLKDNLVPIFSKINNEVPNILQTWWGISNCFGVNLRQEFPERI